MNLFEGCLFVSLVLCAVAMIQTEVIWYFREELVSKSNKLLKTSLDNDYKKKSKIFLKMIFLFRIMCERDMKYGYMGIIYCYPAYEKVKIYLKLN